MDLEDPNFLWMHFRPSFLSHAVSKVLKKDVHLANPTTPVGALPDVGTHNLRKFDFSLAFLYLACPNLQQLCDRIGSRSMAVPMLVYIRNIPGPSFHLCTTLGTLKPGMAQIRFACDLKN